MDAKFNEIMKELVDEYMESCKNIEDERERKLNETVLKMAIEVSVRALEKYESKTYNTSD